MAYFIGVDLGGTNLVVGVVTQEGEVIEKMTTKTRHKQGSIAVADDIAALSKQVLQKANITSDQVQALGVGSPGIIQHGVVSYAVNLGFDEVPLAKLVADRTGFPVNLENDGNAAAYGEAMAGAGKGYDSVIAITIGTGIGGGIVLDKKIISGFNGAAGELGHVVVEATGRRCACGKRGCLEAYCSANAIRDITKESMERNPDSLMWALENGQIDSVSAKTAFQAMKQGDAAGTAVVEEFLFYLSLGISSTINLLQPEIFCVGGGVSREGDTIILPLRDLVRGQTYLKEEKDRTQIIQAKLGSDAGLIGAALSVLQPRATR